jgi:hypothetical protein
MLEHARECLDRTPELNDLSSRPVDDILDPLRQCREVGPDILFRQARRTHFIAERLFSQSCGMIDLLSNPTLQTIHGRDIDLTIRPNVIGHFSAKSWISGAKGDGCGVPEQHIAVAQCKRWRGHLPRDHLLGVIEEVLIVRTTIREADHETYTGASAGTPATLSIVVRPRGYISKGNGFEASYVDSHLERRGTRQHV